MAEKTAGGHNDYTHKPGIPREEVTRRYAEWAVEAKYESDMKDVYKGPIVAADFLCDFFPTPTHRKTARILDIAAGSGLVGMELQSRGFEVIDALEPCSDLLQLAQKKGIYTRTVVNYLDGNVIPEITADYYDAGVVSGGMGEGHIPCKGLDELIRVIKPGGILVIVMQEQYLSTVAEYKDRLEPRMLELESQSKWKRLKKEIVPRYSFTKDGVVYIFRINESIVAEKSANNDYRHVPGISREEVTRRYAEWAIDAKFELDLSKDVYKGPAIIAAFLVDFFPTTEDRKSSRILDIAAGTGLVGAELHDRGFEVIDALDPCSDLLQLAVKKRVYTRTVVNYLDGNVIPDIAADYYDAGVVSGGMGEGHIPCKGLDELVRIIKPGGILVLVMREQYLSTVAEYKDRLEPRMSELESQGKWKRLKREVVPRYSFTNNGVVYIFRITETSA